MADVFEVIRQAHLTDAKQQEKGDLSHMKDYRMEVVKLPAYLQLMTALPEIMTKDSLYMARGRAAADGGSIDGTHTP